MRFVKIFLLASFVLTPLSACAPFDFVSYPFKSSSRGKEPPAPKPSTRETIEEEDLPPQ